MIPLHIKTSEEYNELNDAILTYALYGNIEEAGIDFDNLPEDQEQRRAEVFRRFFNVLDFLPHDDVRHMQYIADATCWADLWIIAEKVHDMQDPEEPIYLTDSEANSLLYAWRGLYANPDDLSDTIKGLIRQLTRESRELKAQWKNIKAGKNAGILNINRVPISRNAVFGPQLPTSMSYALGIPGIPTTIASFLTEYETQKGSRGKVNKTLNNLKRRAQTAPRGGKRKTRRRA
jgi:hypothetical protein